MSTVDLSQWPEADALLEEALALPGGERAHFVAEVHGRNADLGAALAAVLAEAEAADGFLEPGGALSGPIAADLGRQPEDGAALLAPGTLIAGYEIQSLEGRGGMGEVYRARDTRLGRTVALKILPDRFARHPERLARFEREARLLASLSHPGIGGIFGLAEEGPTRALVLEWVEGPTLAERLRRGPLPLDQAIEIGLAIGEALEIAHESGIVHRDLKPGNIKLTPGGVKVLDFGLAKAVVAGEPMAPDDVSTLLDHPGSVLGTPAYMSPEQARAHRVDHRADIWAFGCVLAEMISGRRVFGGATTHEILAGVLERAPDLDGLPPATPGVVRDLLARCLEKDPRRRLGWIGDAIVALEAARDGSTMPETGPERPRPGWRRAWPVLAALGLGALAAGLIVPRLQQPPPPPVTRLAVPIPASDELVAGDLPTVALSADGRHIVYRARREGTVQLFHRALESADPAPIAGSDHAISPAISPDGLWVAFSRDNALIKVPRAGGAPIVVCRTEGAVTPAWASDRTIVFGGELTGGLLRVDASGGTPSRITTLDEAAGEIAHALPEPVAGGQVLFTVFRREGDAGIAMASLAGGAHEPVLDAAHQPRLASGGLLTFIRQRALWAVAFDAGRGAISGSPASVLDEVDTSVVSGVGHFAVSAAGHLAYLPRRTEGSRARALVWTDRSGREEPAPLAPGPFTRAAVSPEGRRIALSTAGAESRNLWMWSDARGTLTRLTFDDSVDTAPVWTADGEHLIYRSNRTPPGLYRVRADGAGSPEQLTSSGNAIHTPYDVSRDGRLVLYTEFRTYTDQGIGMVDVDGGGAPAMLLDGPFAEMRPKLSPDGKWMAYQSDESGRFEIYVRPFPEVRSARWQVSTAGGVTPLWGPGGRELFYYSDGTIIRAPVTAAGTFTVGAPHPLLSADLPGGRLGPVFDLAPDGERFLFLKPVDAADPSTNRLLFVEHWDHDARTRLGPATSARP